MVKLLLFRKGQFSQHIPFIFTETKTTGQIRKNLTLRFLRKFLYCSVTWHALKNRKLSFFRLLTDFYHVTWIRIETVAIQTLTCYSTVNSHAGGWSMWRPYLVILLRWQSVSLNWLHIFSLLSSISKISRKKSRGITRIKQI